MTGIEGLYRQRLAERQAALQAKERTHAAYAWTRIAVFLAGVAILVIGGPSRANWLLVPGAAFAVLVVAHMKLLNARDRARSAVGFYARGLQRVTHDWIGRGRDGSDVFARVQGAGEPHLYAVDIDLFGRASLFELLATARTHSGEETIARWLLAPALPETIRARQAAVRELAGNLDLRERVAVLGDELRVAVHADLLRRWSAARIELRGAGVRVALGAIAAGTASSLAWWMYTGRGALILAVFTAVQLGVAAFYKARVTEVIEAVDEPAHDLELLAELLATIEQHQCTSPALKDLQRRIGSTGRQASAEIRTLSRLVAMLSARNNVMFAIPAGIMMWATHWAFAIEHWRARAGTSIPEWLDVVGEFEALLALSGFAAEQAGYVFPEIADGGPSALVAAQVAHPAMGPAAVANDVRLSATDTDVDGPALLVVSGSNMSGKSTLLRTIGANVVLAGMGAPVRAASFRMTPFAIGASIRVVDSLADGRSRFMAEIERLKQIVDKARDGSGRLLFLLDEILSGTNSHDRRVGAEAVLTGLVGTGAIGLVTTHDLALGEIVDRLPGRAANVHFEDQFAEGTLQFDYQLKTGIVRTSNALALMRSIGIDL